MKLGGALDMRSRLRWETTGRGHFAQAVDERAECCPPTSWLETVGGRPKRRRLDEKSASRSLSPSSDDPTGPLLPN